MTTPWVSVVIPCLNRKDFLISTIESVLKQDYSQIECIVVDGGSKDGTVDLLRSYGEKIKWISEPDRGHADAINKGWKMCRGEILAWLNADDVWKTPNAVSQVVEFFIKNPKVDVVYGDCGRIDSDGRQVGMSYLHPWDLEYAVEYCDHCIPQPAAFIRRSILEKVGWLDIDFYQKKDHELWLRIGLIGQIQYFPVLLAHARNNKGLSYDGKTAAPACIQVTRKFFTFSGLKKNLLEKRRRALSNSYLKGAEYAWEGGRLWVIVLRYVLFAILMDPSNTVRALKELKSYIKRGAGKNIILKGLLLMFLILKLPLVLWREIKLSFCTIREKNLLGDREIEWSWTIVHMPSGPGKVLDFGCGSSFLGLLAAQNGFEVDAMDMQRVVWPYYHPSLHFMQGDLFKIAIPENSFDLIINCSAIEHVGLAGRYGVKETRLNGDLEAMAILKGLMKSGGKMLLTIPVGQDAVFSPMTRIYGNKRLPKLIEGFILEREDYWKKDDQNCWIQCFKEEALNFQTSAGSSDPLQNVYALGCLILRKE